MMAGGNFDPSIGEVIGLAALLLACYLVWSGLGSGCSP